MKNSHKVGSGLLAAVTVLSAISPMMPVMAKSTTKATSSGSTSGNQTSTIKTSVCKGNSKLSGLDAQIFSKIKPDHQGTIVCAKSDGFETKATGTNKVNSYHWTAWYKNSLEDDVDRTQGTGNYHGFSKDKVNEWKQYEENIRKLNGGRFPESKDYIYPTDTKDGKLSFWGDIAGYYSVLGDPQYANIHLEAYQQFSYRVEKTSQSVSYWTDPYYVPSYTPDSGNPPSDDKGGNKPNKKPSKPTGKPDNNKIPKPDGDPKPNKPWEQCFQFLCSNLGQSPNYGIPGQKPRAVQSNQAAKSVGEWNGGPNYDTKSSSRTEYLGNGQYKTVKTTVTSWNETKKVKVADANVAANAYATEIAAYDRIALQPGSRGTLSYNVDHDKFWKVTPSYWVDGGKEVIKNDSSYPYHFGSEGSEGKGKTNVNLYAMISNRDKLYSLIHGYPDITEIKDIPDKNGYPDESGKGNETCATANGKETCSKDETPLIEVEIDMGKDEAQTQVEVDRFVHLTKDKK